MNKDTIHGEVVGTVVANDSDDWEQLGVWFKRTRSGDPDYPSNSAHTSEPGVYKLIRVSEERTRYRPRSGTHPTVPAFKTSGDTVWIDPEFDGELQNATPLDELERLVFGWRQVGESVPLDGAERAKGRSEAYLDCAEVLQETIDDHKNNGGSGDD